GDAHARTVQAEVGHEAPQAGGRREAFDAVLAIERIDERLHGAQAGGREVAVVRIARMDVVPRWACEHETTIPSLPVTCERARTTTGPPGDTGRARLTASISRRTRPGRGWGRPLS